MRVYFALLLLVLLASCATAPQPAVLSQREAHALAQKLASVGYPWLFAETALRESSPPRLVSDRWVWSCRKGIGHGDGEITVSFFRDGTSPQVDYLFLYSELPSPTFTSPIFMPR